MEEKTVQAPAISCNHCTARIEKAMAAIPGVHGVAADAASKKVTLKFGAPAEWPALARALTELGYPPA